MQAGGRVQDHVAGRQLDAVQAVGVFRHQLAALVLVRIAEKQRARHVGAHVLAGERVAADGIVDVIAVGHAALVAVEHRRHGDLGQRRRHEQRIARQRALYQRRQFARGLALRRQLQIVFDVERLVAGGGTAVLPLGIGQQHAGVGQFFGGEDFGDVQQHGVS
ncbi:hypothetical protein D3C72_1529350 [compost metagenome]